MLGVLLWKGRVRRVDGESSLIAYFSAVAAVWGGAPVKTGPGWVRRGSGTCTGRPYEFPIGNEYVWARD